MSKIRQKGQVTLLAVILGVLGLTLGLSVASRSLSDLRQASTVDFGTKALAAAEAGVEYGLAQIAANANFSVTQQELVDLIDGPLKDLANIGIKTLKLDVSRPVAGFARSNGVVAKDDVFQVDFSSGSPPQRFDIFWTDADGIEVAALSTTYAVSRFAYKRSGSAVAASFDPAAGCDPVCDAFPAGSCSRVDTGGTNTLLLRIKPVQSQAEILVCPVGGTIPSQYYEVTATATTRNGTVKKVRVRRDVSGTLPGIFDNVLYSGGSISK